MRWLKWLILIVVVIVIIVIPVRYYNLFVTYEQKVRNAWAEVENQLKRRNDLIPNLVNSVKGYMGHEREIFEYVADARAKLAGAMKVGDRKKIIESAGELGMALGRLLAIVERYPELKADRTFIRLMDELAGTENRIAVARKRYNDTVREYNIIIKRFPGNIFAHLYNKSEEPYFTIPEEEKATPKVEF